MSTMAPLSEGERKQPGDREIDALDPNRKSRVLTSEPLLGCQIIQWCINRCAVGSLGNEWDGELSCSFAF
jgi:hypothetical protein